jgi:hypothetical protein
MGRGERAAIALAHELDAGLVVLEDEEGRKEARRHGLSVTGSIGILIEAKEQDIIASLRHELDRLIDEGLWIDERLYDRVLREYCFGPIPKKYPPEEQVLSAYNLYRLDGCLSYWACTTTEPYWMTFRQADVFLQGRKICPYLPIGSRPSWV